MKFHCKMNFSVKALKFTFHLSFGHFNSRSKCIFTLFSKRLFLFAYAIISLFCFFFLKNSLYFKFQGSLLSLVIKGFKRQLKNQHKENQGDCLTQNHKEVLVCSHKNARYVANTVYNTKTLDTHHMSSLQMQQHRR